MKIKKTRKNPHGLTPKRQMVVDAVVEDIDSGKGMQLAKATEKIYDVKNKQNASNIASRLWKNDDFRAALTHGLKKRHLIGTDSRVEQALDEGLDATSKKVLPEGKGHKVVDEVDFKTRLDYVKEINKISGVYAPEKSESKKMVMNIDLTREELDEKLKLLKSELEGE